jgi:DNA-binding NarL/FixJ family response regulator
MTSFAEIDALTEPQAPQAEPPGGLGGTRVVIVSPEPLEGFAMKALLETLGAISTYAETPARALRMLAGHEAVVLWIGDEMDAEALRIAIEMRRQEGTSGLCIVARSVHAAMLRELLATETERFALLSRGDLLNTSELVDALSRIARGRGFLDGAVVRRLLVPEDPARGKLGGLTCMEAEVLELLASGLRNCEIAKRLWKSEKTIEKHVHNVFAKLGLEESACRHLDRRVAAALIYSEAQHSAA